MPRESPKVSVCIPTYNYGHYIGQAIDSVLAQDFDDFEILVLDNDSRDQTPDVLAAYRDPRIRYIRNPSNLGFVRNVNKGLDLARGAYFSVLCADDIWYQGILRKETQLLDQYPQMGIVHTAEYCIDSHNQIIRRHTAPWKPMTPGTDAFLEFFRHGWFLSFSSCMMRRNLLKKIGGLQPEFGLIADSGMFLRMCLEGDIGFIDECLVGYRLHGGSLTNEILRNGTIFQDQQRLIDRVFHWEEVHRRGLATYKNWALEHLAKHMVRHIHIARLEGGRTEAWHCIRRALKLDSRILFAPNMLIRGLSSLLLPQRLITRIQTHRRQRALARLGIDH